MQNADVPQGNQYDPGILPAPGGRLEEQLPPQIVATPADLRIGTDEDLNWWRPGWGDMARHVGWRWIFLTPAAGLLVLGAALFFTNGLAGVILVMGAKLLIFVGVIAISLAGFVIRRAAAARSEPFCIHCGYNLSGLPDNHRCPECGRSFTWRVIAEYRRDPQWFVERWKAQRELPKASSAFEAGLVRKKRRKRDGT